MGGGAGLERSLFAAAVLLFAAGYQPGGAGGSGIQPAARGEGVLRVVTWNVGGTGGDLGSGLRDEHLDRIAETLLALDPDLSFLQEVRDDGQLALLTERLGDGWDALIERRGQRRVAVLSRRGTVRRLRLPRRSRPALGVRYDAPGRPGVAAVAVHADAFSARRRNDQIGAATDAILAWLDEPGVEVGLLVGDLNLDLDLGKRRDLFTDDEYRDVETYNFVSKHLRDVGLGRGSTAEPDRRLDYVFVGPRSQMVVEAGPWKGRRVGDMDHDPVLADLMLP